MDLGVRDKREVSLFILYVSILFELFTVIYCFYD